MINRKLCLAAVLSLAVASGNGIVSEATLGEVIGEGITTNFNQISNTEAVVEAAAEVVWAGTPLEGYVNIGIAKVDDSLNIRTEASADSKLAGKLRKDSACEIIGTEGEWSQIVSGEVEGYVKTEFLYTGEEAVAIALELGDTLVHVKTDGLYVRSEPNTESTYWTQVATGETLPLLEDMGDWIKVQVDSEVGYVAAEYVEISNELKTALTITEAIYGEGVTDARIAVCEYALQFVGNPYVWGGTSLTRGADCSGFTMSVYKNFGVSLPHSSRAQINNGKRVSLNELQPGDLVFYGGSVNSISHVALYTGNGRIVHASTSTTGIITGNLYYRTPVGAISLIND